MKIFRLVSILALLALPLCAVTGEIRAGADAASPRVASFLELIPMKSGSIYTFSDDETRRMVAMAAEAHINVFELLDCAYRYAAPRGFRISVSGSSLRKAQATHDLGGERVLALLPVSKMIRMEAGAAQQAGQNALDVYLDSDHEAYIEIGTAVYDRHFGFARIDPLLFSSPFGIEVKKLFFTAPLKKLELYEPAKAAIYASGISKPKRWVLHTVTPK